MPRKRRSLVASAACVGIIIGGSVVGIAAGMPLVGVFSGFIIAMILAELTRPRILRVPRGCCPACGYNLTGNASGTCPECGTPFEVYASSSPNGRPIIRSVPVPENDPRRMD